MKNMEKNDLQKFITKKTKEKKKISFKKDIIKWPIDCFKKIPLGRTQLGGHLIVKNK